MEGAGARTRSNQISRVGGYGSRGYRLCRRCKFEGVCVVSRGGQLMLACLGRCRWEIWEDGRGGG